MQETYGELSPNISYFSIIQQKPHTVCYALPFIVSYLSRPLIFWVIIWMTIIYCEVKFAQLCLTLCEPMDYTVHGILQARMLEWVARGSSPGDLLLQGIFPTQGSNLGLLHRRKIFTLWATREAPLTYFLWTIKFLICTLEEACSVWVVSKSASGEFPGGPVAKTPCSQGREPSFDSWAGN